MDEYHYPQPYCRYRPQYKSHVERQIGDLLTDRRIPFIYEKPTAVMDDGKLRTWYPDFSLRYGLLIEYFGVNGERDYLERTRHKLRVYQANQFDMIPLYPADIIPDWQKRLIERIGSVMENRARDLFKLSCGSLRQNQQSFASP
jgi:hypothetical protein